MTYDLDAAIKALQAKQLKQAESILASFEKHAATDPYFWNVKAAVAIQNQDFKKAILFLKKALNLKHDDIGFLQNLAVCYKNLCQYSDAQESLEQALKLDKNNIISWRSLGNLYAAQEHKQKMIEAYQQAIRAGDKNITVLHQVALDCLNDFKFEQAITYYQQILTQRPDNESILFELSTVYLLIRDIAAGIKYLTSLKSIAKRGDLIDFFIASLRLWSKDWSHYEADLQIILDHTKKQLSIPNAMPQIAAFTALFYIADNQLNLEIAKRFSIYKPSMTFSHTIDKSKKNKKLRVGYVSDDFRNHPVAHLCKRLFECMNSDDVESYIYAHGGDDASEYRKHIKKTATKYRDISKLSYAKIAQIINEDNIDILVDMKGQTTNSILPMFAYRPAPIQIAYLGYPGTTGAEYIDYIIVDKVVAPKTEQKHFTEKFIYLPHCYQVNDDQQLISNENVSRQDMSLPEDKFIYCCFNNTYKIEPHIFSIWMQILKAVPDSVLWLLSSTPVDDMALRKYASEQGINPERIIFSEKTSKDKHLRRLQLADLFLDTYVVGAHTTASDSLWAGVPILTCVGNRFISRVCSSLLSTQGLNMLIANSLDEYQQKAIYYGKHPQDIVILKHKIKDANKTKPLFNTAMYATNLARAYRLVWEKYCDGLSPAIIDVGAKN